MSLIPASPHENRLGVNKAPRPSSASIALNLPSALTEAETQHLTSIITDNRRLKRGESLYRTGEAFTSLFILRSGSMISSILAEDGREQVTGFPMPGELLGLDAISFDRHPSTALALEDVLIYELPFEALMSAAAHVPGLQRKFYQLMSREIVKDQGAMMLLGNMNAEEKLATFLINLSRNYESRGFSPTRFQLRMRREDIGSYLGVQLETISRTLSKFQGQGLIRVHMRELELLDIERLREMVDRGAPQGLH